MIPPIVNRVLWIRLVHPHLGQLMLNLDGTDIFGGVITFGSSTLGLRGSSTGAINMKVCSCIRSSFCVIYTHIIKRYAQ